MRTSSSRFNVNVTLRFGRFEWLPASRELHLDGQPVSIRARALDVLRVLIERRERLVSKGELLELVWSGLVVEENNLQVQISALRKLLGPQAIATVPGRGYRFTAAIEGTGGDRESAAEPAKSAAPAASTATIAPTPNLPAELAPLHGRAEDVAALRTLVAAHRLVTVVGSGGIGKTRLAQAVAHAELGRCEDGVWWIDLTSADDASRLFAAIGVTLGIASRLGEDARSHVLRSLRTRRALIALDNCEHLQDAVADLIGDALAEAPHVQWLLTSQLPLKLADEQIYRLGPLPVPPPGTAAKDAMRFGALALLAQHVTAADRRYSISDSNVESAIDLCAQLDGIPLAIEMAAARVPALGLDRVRMLLGERLRLLAAGHRTPLARHRTLHAALDWSHSLLAAPERTVLRRLGVFTGGFTLELAQGVVGGPDLYSATGSVDEWDVVDALEGLIEKSMVQTLLPADSGDPRYSLLETTRLYALERLSEAGETEASQARHARAMAAFAERAYANHWTESDIACITRMQPEIENLRNALHWAIAHSDVESAAAIVGSTWPLFRLLDRQYEAQTWMNAAEPLLSQASDVRAARGLAAVVYVFSGRGGPRVIPIAREAVRRYRGLDDPRGLYFALCGLAFAGLSFGEPDSEEDRDARAALAELDRIEEPGWPARLRCWAIVARTTSLRDDRVARIAPLREMHELARSAGATERALTAQVNILGVLHGLDRKDEAIELAHAIIESRQLAGERLGWVLLSLAEVLAERGNTAESRDAASEGLRVMRQCNGALEAFARLASIALIERRVEDAARIAGHAQSILARSGIERGAQLRLLEDVVAKIDTRLATERRRALMNEGARLSEAQATALALPSRP